MRATTRFDAMPLPYTIYDRMRDKLIAQRADGYLTKSEYAEAMRSVDEAERRHYERAKARRWRT